jgi:hypothetical protein
MKLPWSPDSINRRPNKEGITLAIKLRNDSGPL